MTYHELMMEIIYQGMKNPEVFEQTVTILAVDDLHESECYPAADTHITDKTDVTDGLLSLDTGHFVIIVNG